MKLPYFTHCNSQSNIENLGKNLKTMVEKCHNFGIKSVFILNLVYTIAAGCQQDLLFLRQTCRVFGLDLPNFDSILLVLLSRTLPVLSESYRVFIQFFLFFWARPFLFWFSPCHLFCHSFHFLNQSFWVFRQSFSFSDKSFPFFSLRSSRFFPLYVTFWLSCTLLTKLKM